MANTRMVPRTTKRKVIMTAYGNFETDVLHTSAGELSITFLGHGSLLMSFQGKIIYVDVFGEVADYSKLPKADIVFLTHEHFDHLDPKALASIRTDKTVMVYTEGCEQMVKGGIVMHNGDRQTVAGIPVEAVAAYNLVHMRPSGDPFHPKRSGNGYIITFGGTRLYVAGDTENTPEMKALKEIDIAFLPMNLPYTMTPEMVADAVKAFRPSILYPYHYGDTDVSKLVGLLKGEKGIEVRIRKMP
jgi:L-ascorbate metabolism protein UlaG (beta-lactamase superfamily)